MKKISKGNLLIHIVLIIGAIIMILPFIWMILTSFKTLGESTQIPPKIFQIHYNLVTTQRYFVYYLLDNFTLIHY